jgi:hypothetical protein
VSQFVEGQEQIECFCGGKFVSTVKYTMREGFPKVVTEVPCPQCHKQDNVKEILPEPPKAKAVFRFSPVKERAAPKRTVSPPFQSHEEFLA